MLVWHGIGFREGAPSDEDGAESDAAASTPTVADRGRIVGAMMISLLMRFGLVCTTETNEIITKYEIVSVCGGDWRWVW